MIDESLISVSTFLAVKKLNQFSTQLNATIWIEVWTTDKFKIVVKLKSLLVMCVCVLSDGLLGAKYWNQSIYFLCDRNINQLGYLCLMKLWIYYYFFFDFDLSSSMQIILKMDLNVFHNSTFTTKWRKFIYLKFSADFFFHFLNSNMKFIAPDTTVINQ